MKLSIFDQFFKCYRLFCLYSMISFKYLKVYKLSSFLTVLFSVIFLIAEFLTINVYYKFDQTIGDWDQSSFYMLVGSFNIMLCLYTFLFEIAHDEFIYKVKYGELDSFLTKPIDSQILLSIQRIDYPSLFSLPIPIWIVYHGVQGLNLDITPLSFLAYCLVISIGVFIIYLVNHFTVACSFWFTDSSNLTTLSNQMIQLGSRPIQVYPRIIQLGFSYIVPILLCTSLSVDVLKEGFHAKNLGLLIVASLVLFLIVRIQWKLGLRRYSSASS